MSTMSVGRASRPETLSLLSPGGAPKKRSHSLPGLEETPKRTIIRHTRTVWSASAADIPRPGLLGFICSGDSQRRASSASQPNTTTRVRRTSATTSSTESLNALVDSKRSRREQRASSMESTTSNSSVRSVTGRTVRTPLGSVSPAIKHRTIKHTGSEAPAESGAASAEEETALCATASPVVPPLGVGASHHRTNLWGGPRFPSGFMDRVAYDIPHHLDELERQLGLTSSMSSFSTMSTLDVESADLNTTRLELEMELEDEMLTLSDSSEELLTDAELSHVSHAITRETPKLSASDQELDIRYQRLVAWASEAAKGEKPKPPPVIESDISIEVAATTSARPGINRVPQVAVDEPAILTEDVQTARTCPTMRRRAVSPPIVPLKAPEAVVELVISPIEITEAEMAPTIVTEQEIVPPQITPPPDTKPHISPSATTQEEAGYKISPTGTSQLEHEISQRDTSRVEILPPETREHEDAHRKMAEISTVTELNILRPHMKDREMSPLEFTEVSEDQENWNRIDTKLKLSFPLERIPMAEDVCMEPTLEPHIMDDTPIESTSETSMEGTRIEPTLETIVMEDTPIESTVETSIVEDAPIGSTLETSPMEDDYFEPALETIMGDAYTDHLSAFTMETVVMETEKGVGGVVGMGETPGGARAVLEEGMEVGEGEVEVSEGWGAATGAGPAGCLPPPPPPPPSPTPSPGETSITPPLSSAAGSITTISTTGLLETEFNDLEEVPVHVEVIPEEDDEAEVMPARRDRAATPPSDEFYKCSDQQYDSLPGYYPWEGDVDQPESFVSESVYSDAYDQYYQPVGESTYMGATLDEDQYPLEASEPAFSGGEEEVGGSRSSSQAYTEQAEPRILREEQQHHAMEEQEPYSTVEERLSHLEEQVNNDLPPFTGRVQEVLPSTAHPPQAGSDQAARNIPTETHFLTDVEEVKVTPAEKPKLKGILKKTSSFDLKESDKKSKAVEAVHDVNTDSEAEPAVARDREAQPPGFAPGGEAAAHTRQPETELGQTDKPEVEELRRRVPVATTDVTAVTTSFPSLSDVIHAKSFDLGALDVRTRLTLLDTVINFLLLTPLTVLFYYATCRLLQLSLLRMLPLLGPWLLLLLGSSIEFVASFCQRSVAARAPKPEVGRPPFADVNLPFLLTAKSFNFVLGFGNVCHMMAMSSLVDMYVGTGFGVGLRVALTSLVVLWTLRCGRNVVAPPLYIGVDPDDLGVFASTTMFRVEPDMSVESGADILGTIAVMTSFVHLHWAGIWNCADAVLFPAYFVLSMMTSLLLGSTVCLLFLLLQQPAGEISRNLERQKKEPLRIAFENVFNTTANIGVVLLWRGLWMVYDVMADYFPIYCRSWDIAPLAACALSFLLLALAHCSSSLLFKGCEVDGELRGGAGVSFTTGYFTEILQGHWDADPDESGSTNKPTPEKPAAASSAIPSQVLGVTTKTLAAAEQPKSPNGSTPTLKQKLA